MDEWISSVMSTYGWTWEQFLGHERKVVKMLCSGNNKGIKRMNKDIDKDTGIGKHARIKFKNKADRDRNNKNVMSQFGQG